MPQQPNGMESLRTLLRLRPQGPTDPYVSRRTAEITSGLDDYVPGADSVATKDAQVEHFNQTGWAPARADIQQDQIAKVRAGLNLDAIEHQQRMEGIERSGRLAIEKERQAAAALGDRMRYQQEQQNQRQEMNQAAIMDRLNKTLGAQAARQEDQQQFKIDNPTTSSRTGAGVPASMYHDLDKANQAYNDSRGSLFGRIGRWATGKDSEAVALEQSLTNYLDRKGDLSDAINIASRLKRYQGSFDEKLAQAVNDPEFEFDVTALDPYTRRYLELKVGQ